MTDSWNFEGAEIQLIKITRDFRPTKQQKHKIKVYNIKDLYENIKWDILRYMAK